MSFTSTLLLVLALEVSASTNVAAAQATTLPIDAQSSISAALGRDLPEYQIRPTGNGVVAHNRPQQLTSRFTTGGMEVEIGKLRWTMALRDYGYGRTRRVVQTVAPQAASNRVEYRRGLLTEWYMNGPGGLEQGFEIRKCTCQSSGLPLTITLELSSNVTGRVDKDRKGATLTGGDGEHIRYAGLDASDASGKALRTWLQLQGRRLLISVQDAGAQYPIVVDPVLQLAELRQSVDTQENGLFGTSVAISGDTIVVGAGGENTSPGAAYVFVRPPSGWRNMIQTAELTASDGNDGDYLGGSVSISGDTIVAGAAGVSRGLGAAYVFVRPEGGWTNMTQTAKLKPSDGVEFGNFGIAIAIDGNTVVVGQPNFAKSQGAAAAYVFVKPASGWTDMTQTAKLTGSDGVANEFSFGLSVGISNNVIVAGGEGYNLDQGAIYLFVQPDGGWVDMTETATLTASDGERGDLLGALYGAAISGDTVVGGAEEADNGKKDASGAVYVFIKPKNGWTNSTETAKLTVSIGKTGDQLGVVSISPDGKTVAVGEPIADRTRPAYVFLKPESGWATTSRPNFKLQPAAGTQIDDYGFSIGVSERAIVVGAPFANVDGKVQQGLAYVFGHD
jgi:hypothetical protein